MNTAKPAFTARLAAFTGRLSLDETRAAAALGVPVGTYKKWANGTRCPSAAAVRVLDILEALEALAPAMLEAFLPPRNVNAAHVSKSKRGRPRKVAVSSPGAEAPL
jgi:hypothetical protein